MKKNEASKIWCQAPALHHEYKAPVKKLAFTSFLWYEVHGPAGLNWVEWTLIFLLLRIFLFLFVVLFQILFVFFQVFFIFFGFCWNAMRVTVFRRPRRMTLRKMTQKPFDLRFFRFGFSWKSGLSLILDYTDGLSDIAKSWQSTVFPFYVSVIRKRRVSWLKDWIKGWCLELFAFFLLVYAPPYILRPGGYGLTTIQWRRRNFWHL